MIRTLLRIHPKRSRADLVAAFKRLDVLALSSATPGFVAAELHEPSGAEVADDAPIVVTSLWESEAAYMAWRNSDTAARLSAALEPVVAHSEEPQVWSLRVRVP